MLFKKNIPVSRPMLPDIHNLTPYLKDINANNMQYGKRPVLHNLESRFEKLFHVEAGNVCLTSNYISALTNTLRAIVDSDDGYCIMPSWAPSVLPYAAIYAGLKPFFIDVDAESWTIEPHIVNKSLANIDGKVSAIIVPEPFGQAIPTDIWDNFTDETGIPVIIDATTGFDAILIKSKSSPSKTPIIIGLHTNSTLNIDGGGIVICKNKNLMKKVSNICHFGTVGNNSQTFSGTNSLMSEYKAALCHASLDNWNIERSRWQSLTSNYIEAFIDTTLQHRLSFDFISSSCNVFLPNAQANEMIGILHSNGIEACKWLGDGCHRIEEFKNCPTTALPITEQLADSVIGLPFYIGLSKREVELIVKLINNQAYGIKIRQEVKIAS